MVKGKLITIEGGEGAGKSTALAFIKRYFLQRQINCLFTREPGGTEIAEQIRQLILHALSDESVLPETELLLMFAARAQHIKTCILPALESGQFVVSDRYVDASYAYQGGGRGMDNQYITMLDKWIVGDVCPDLTLLFDIDPVLGFERTKNRGASHDRIEREKIAFFKRVRERYLERAQNDKRRIKIIDASQTVASVEKQLEAVLDAFMMTV